MKPEKTKEENILIRWYDDGFPPIDLHNHVPALMALIREVKELRKPDSGWIPVSERLPELDPTKTYSSVYCIVATEDSVQYARFKEDTLRGKKVKRWHSFAGLFRGVVTHWMELPKPPKG